MKKYLWLVILVILFVFAISKHSNKTIVNADKETIKIGVSLPLTGNLSSIGVPPKESILMAIDDINKKDNKFYYEVIIENDAFEAKRASMTINKLINSDKVDAAITAYSTTGNIATLRTQDAKVPHICFGASDTNIAKGDYNFMHWTMPQAEVDKLIEILKKEKLTNVGIFSANQSGALAVLKSLEPSLEKNNIKYFTEIINPNEKDFRSTIAIMKEKKPQVYFFLVFPPALEVLAKQLKEMGENKPLTAIEAFNFVEDKSIFEGQWYIGAAEINDEFAKRFRDRAKIESIFAVGNSYDAIILFYNAFESYKGEGKPSGEYIKDYLSNVKNYHGKVGNISVDENGIFQSQAIVKVIKDGKSIKLEDK